MNGNFALLESLSTTSIVSQTNKWSAMLADQFSQITPLDVVTALVTGFWWAW